MFYCFDQNTKLLKSHYLQYVRDFSVIMRMTTEKGRMNYFILAGIFNEIYHANDTWVLLPMDY